MRMYDIIAAKRDGGKLTKEQIDFFIGGYTRGEIPDYQMSALAMAIYLRGMDAEETAWLTAAMAASGDMADLSGIEGVKGDKHSTGGVGDKTTLIVAPIAASCGVKIAKMSGRGLGHTGGTLDKLESIPGCSVSLTEQQFIRQVNDIGIAVIGQTGDLAPADKKLYALRDVTATVSSLPLIASSIMSKKLAGGADCILLDVKTGSGAFMKTLEDSIALAKAMVEIGEHNGRHTAALITDMDTPLGCAVGNSLEVIEAAENAERRRAGRPVAGVPGACGEPSVAVREGDFGRVRGHGGRGAFQRRAFETLCRMVRAQGGDDGFLRDTSRFAKAPCRREVRCGADGFLTATDTEKIGLAAVALGAGRETKESSVDPAAGLHVLKKAGDKVRSGDVLAVLYAADEAKLDAAEEVYRGALTVSQEPPAPVKLIFARVDRGGVTML